jgi:hypothetical protein
MELENSADNMALEPYWATGGQLALRGPLAVAAPGRILNETYQSLGIFTERHANRAGYRLGFGPVAIVERIQKLIGVGLERESRLQEIRNDAGPKLKKNCLKLIGYASPYVRRTLHMNPL